MSRRPNPETKRALALMTDGKSRTAQEVADELGMTIEAAYKVIRSLSKQRELVATPAVFRYSINAAGMRRAQQAKELDERSAAREAELQKKAEWMRARRQAVKEAREERDLEDFRQDADEIVAQAMASQHPLAGVWA